MLTAIHVFDILSFSVNKGTSLLFQCFEQLPNGCQSWGAGLNSQFNEKQRASLFRPNCSEAIQLPTTHVAGHVPVPHRHIWLSPGDATLPLTKFGKNSSRESFSALTGSVQHKIAYGLNRLSIPCWNQYLPTLCYLP